MVGLNDAKQIQHFYDEVDIDVLVEVHVDDFHVTGPENTMNMSKNMLQKQLLTIPSGFIV